MNAFFFSIFLFFSKHKKREISKIDCEALLPGHLLKKMWGFFWSLFYEDLACVWLTLMDEMLIGGSMDEHMDREDLRFGNVFCKPASAGKCMALLAWELHCRKATRCFHFSFQPCTLTWENLMLSQLYRFQTTTGLDVASLKTGFLPKWRA